MDLAIKLDNRLFERRQEQRQQQKPVSQYNSKSNVGPHSRYQQNYQQNRVFENRRDQVHTRQSGPATHNSLPRPDDPMDIDSAHRGPLTPAERQHRMSRGLCLVCGESGHLRINCPKSRFRAAAVVVDKEEECLPAKNE
ncbi:hypothetical protein BASA81_018511 [Batrachochytrium salamandrivorans]|nr:hypothetical protein BASA81_018511 [Batrachochytrium salamandrivorans]